MKKVLIGIIIGVLSVLGSFAAQDRKVFQTVKANLFQTEFVAGKSNYFVQASGNEERCTVSDPTGTSLNVRATPNGKITGKLKNGIIVYIVVESGDTQDRSWSQIKLTRRGKVKGWVLTEFLDCA